MSSSVLLLCSLVCLWMACVFDLLLDPSFHFHTSPSAFTPRSLSHSITPVFYFLLVPLDVGFFFHCFFCRRFFFFEPFFSLLFDSKILSSIPIHSRGYTHAPMCFIFIFQKLNFLSLFSFLLLNISQKWNHLIETKIVKFVLMNTRLLFICFVCLHLRRTIISDIL
jgi:hypothetical protein